MKAILIFSFAAVAFAGALNGDFCPIPAQFLQAPATTGCQGAATGFVVDVVCINPQSTSTGAAATFSLNGANNANSALLVNQVTPTTVGCFVPSEAVGTPAVAATTNFAGALAVAGTTLPGCSGATPTSDPLFPTRPFLKGINVRCDIAQGYFQTAGNSGTLICASTVPNTPGTANNQDAVTRYFTNIVTPNAANADTVTGQFIPPLFLAGPNAPLTAGTAAGGTDLACARACVLPANVCTGAGVFNPSLSVFNFFTPVTGNGFGIGNGVVTTTTTTAPVPVPPQTVTTTTANGQFNGLNSGFGQNGVIPGTCLVRPGTTVNIVQNFGQGNGQVGSVTNPFQFSCPLTGGLNAGTFLNGNTPVFVVDGAVTGIIIQPVNSFNSLTTTGTTTGATGTTTTTTTTGTTNTQTNIVLPGTTVTVRSAKRQTINNLNNFPGVTATVTNSGPIALGQFGGSRISANVIRGQTTAAAFQNGIVQTITITGCEQLANRGACVQAALNQLRCQGLVIDSSTACFAGTVLIACPTPALGFNCNNHHSKKGLLGLLGLLGLIPLLLCCLLLFCCLIPCCLRRRKTEADVHFATFDPHAAPVAASVIAPSAVGFGGPAYGGPTAVF